MRVASLWHRSPPVGQEPQTTVLKRAEDDKGHRLYGNSTANSVAAEVLRIQFTGTLGTIAAIQTCPCTHIPSYHLSRPAIAPSTFHTYGTAKGT